MEGHQTIRTEITAMKVPTHAGVPWAIATSGRLKNARPSLDAHHDISSTRGMG
jgi:hypothetical protein